jgi:hypothetical protein
MSLILEATSRKKSFDQTAKEAGSLTNGSASCLICSMFTFSILVTILKGQKLSFYLSRSVSLNDSVYS